VEKIGDRRGCEFCAGRGSDFAITHGQAPAHGGGCYLAARDTRNAVLASAAAAAAVAVVVVVVAVTAVAMYCRTVVCRTTKMYIRCLIVILALALAQIFPTVIEACTKKKVTKEYPSLRECKEGREGLQSCCAYCTHNSKARCLCKAYTTTFLTIKLPGAKQKIKCLCK